MRTFTVEASKTQSYCEIPSGGCYKSEEPLSAAKKAARQLFKKATAKTRKIHFTLRETTRGSDKTEYKYVATKKKLAKPMEVKFGDTKVLIHHEYEVKSADSA